MSWVPCALGGSRRPPIAFANIDLTKKSKVDASTMTEDDLLACDVQRDDLMTAASSKVPVDLPPEHPVTVDEPRRTVEKTATDQVDEEIDESVTQVDGDQETATHVTDQVNVVVLNEADTQDNEIADVSEVVEMCQESAAQELPTLPDDVLIEVFKQLCVQDLLVVRAVCRRWRDVSAHPDVWHDVILSDQIEREFRVMPAALRVAPCLAELQLTSGKGRALSTIPALLADTKCAVEVLMLGPMDDRVDGEVDLATRIVRNQGRLGRLRTLDVIEMNLRKDMEPGLIALLSCAVSIERLLELDLSGDLDTRYSEPLPAPPGTVPAAPLRPSLVTFVGVSWLPDALLEFVLRSHASTLKVVDMSRARPVLRDALPATLLLLGMPHLTKLSCPPLDDMQLLLDCPALECLNLYVDGHPPGPPSGDAMRATEEFLAGAVRLKHVSFWYLAEAFVADLLVDLVSALASSGNAAVEMLVLQVALSRWGSFRASTHPVEPLPPTFAAALRGLPRLDVLDTGRFPISFDFFQKLHVPNLSWMLATPPDGCNHVWMHQPEVRDVLVRNPRLHLIFLNSVACVGPDQVQGQNVVIQAQDVGQAQNLVQGQNQGLGQDAAQGQNVCEGQGDLGVVQLCWVCGSDCHPGLRVKNSSVCLVAHPAFANGCEVDHCVPDDTGDPDLHNSAHFCLRCRIPRKDNIWLRDCACVPATLYSHCSMHLRPYLYEL